MQIDFHHTVTYVLARLAGMTHADAIVVAYAAQYVDDATNSGTIQFKDGSKYERIASAHEIYDAKANIRDSSNYNSWVPFHFFPGNNGALPDNKDNIQPILKLFCQPDSPIVNDLLNEVLSKQNESNFLHRLGITIHVYADTWAHQRFAGITHMRNFTTNLNCINLNVGDNIKVFGMKVIGDTLGFGLGHGSAGTCPDIPFLEWKYIDGFGKPCLRNNCQLFIDACKKIYMLIRRALNLDSSIPIQTRDLEMIEHAFKTFREIDGDIRHRSWFNLISSGSFSFPALSDIQIESLKYIPFGIDSWKYKALGTTEKYDKPNDKYEINPDFNNSNWKKFHDALRDHQIMALTSLLPKYGIFNKNI